MIKPILVVTFPNSTSAEYLEKMNYNLKDYLKDYYVLLTCSKSDDVEIGFKCYL